MSNAQVPGNFLTQFWISSNLVSQFIVTVSVFNQEVFASVVQDEQSTKGWGSHISQAPNLNCDSSASVIVWVQNSSYKL